MITKETLFATRRDATPAQKMDLRMDVEVPAGRGGNLRWEA